MAEKKKTMGYGQQISVLMSALETLRTDRNDEKFEKIIGWVKDLPPSFRPPELVSALCRSFNIHEMEARKLLEVKSEREDFDMLVPSHGWLADYVRYTRTTEPPTVFHFFVGATVLGAAVRRNLFYDKGFGKLFPNVCVILVAPSGKCRKTSACELGMKLLRQTGVMVLADKITPEALVNAYAESGGDATGLIYAGELKQFLGSQKYMEGMIPLLTRLLDCPDEWSSQTIGKGELKLINVAFSMLGASTMDWLRMLPGDSFGGGFMSRFLLVVQEDTPRSFPLPPPMDDGLKASLISRLRDYTNLRARFHLTPAARKWYEEWYNSKSLSTEEKLFAGYFERKPDNLFRLGMLLSLSEDTDAVLQLRHLEQALKILNWVESWLPHAFGQLGANAVGEEHFRLVHQLKKSGGALKHSDWLRKNAMRMNAATFKNCIATLREMKLVDFDVASSTYFLTPEGWKQGG